MSLRDPPAPTWHGEVSFHPSAIFQTRRQGNGMDWAALPIQQIPLDTLVWPCHDISPGHTHPAPDTILSSGPIHVQPLVDGSHFVHDGRHRAIRASLAGHTHIAARIHP